MRGFFSLKHGKQYQKIQVCISNFCYWRCDVHSFDTMGNFNQIQVPTVSGATETYDKKKRRQK